MNASDIYESTASTIRAALGASLSLITWSPLCAMKSMTESTHFSLIYIERVHVLGFKWRRRNSPPRYGAGTCAFYHSEADYRRRGSRG